MWAFELGKSSWRNVCVWEGQVEEAIPSGRSGTNKRYGVGGRIPEFARVKKIRR